MRWSVLIVLGSLVPAAAMAQTATPQSGLTPTAPNLSTPQAQSNMAQEPPNAQVQHTGPAVGAPNTVPTPTLSNPNTPIRQ